MTYEKAVEQFREKIGRCENGKENLADVLAFFALSKQVARLVKKRKYDYMCPTCEMPLVDHKEAEDKDNRYDYCPFCGQCLKWEEVNPIEQFIFAGEIK